MITCEKKKRLVAIQITKDADLPRRHVGKLLGRKNAPTYTWTCMSCVSGPLGSGVFLGWCSFWYLPQTLVVLTLGNITMLVALNLVEGAMTRCLWFFEFGSFSTMPVATMSFLLNVQRPMRLPPDWEVLYTNTGRSYFWTWEGWTWISGMRKQRSCFWSNIPPQSFPCGDSDDVKTIRNLGRFWWSQVLNTRSYLEGSNILNHAILFVTSKSPIANPIKS